MQYSNTKISTVSRKKSQAENQTQITNQVFRTNKWLEISIGPRT